MKDKNLGQLRDIIKDIIFFENSFEADGVVFVPKDKIDSWQRDLFYLLTDEEKKE